MHSLTQYGRWDFLWYMLGFINYDKILTITFNLFIWIWSKISAFFPLINHQYFHNLSLQLKSHIPQINSHFSPYLSIWIPGNLTINNLFHTALQLACQRPTLGSLRKFLLLVYFRLVGGLVLSCCCTSLYVTVSVLQVLSYCCTSLYVTLSVLHNLSHCCT